MKISSLNFIAFLMCFACSSALASDNSYRINELNTELIFEEKQLYKIAPRLLVQQAKDSLPHVEKDIEFHCERNYGSVGEALYSMLCYSNSEEPDKVQLIGELRFRGKLWNYQIKIPRENFVNNILVVVESLPKLAYNKFKNENAASGSDASSTRPF